MYMIFVAIGEPAAQLARQDLTDTLQLPAACMRKLIRHADNFLSLVCTPPGGTTAVASSADARRNLLLDGYVAPESAASPGSPSSLAYLLDRIWRKGISKALSECRAGSFNVVYADFDSEEYLIASDRIGSIPLYYARVGDGFIVSTNPRTLIATGLLSTDLDWAGCASWLYFGYPLRDRHILRAIRSFPSHSVLRWSPFGARIYPIEHPFTSVVPNRLNAREGTLAVADRVRRACQTVSEVPGRLAHLQSAGMDSRLILAALPDDAKPSCFTYGRPDSTEIPIAQQVARTRGVDFNHYWPDGDSVADALDAMFNANGLMVYPDRYLIAREMQRRGFHKVTDGFLGDVLLGGTYYKCDQLFGSFSKISRYAMVYVDQSVSKIGLDSISHKIFSTISEIIDLRRSFDFLTEEFLDLMEQQRSVLLGDIQAECLRLDPRNDSLGILFRNFLIQNRSRAAIAQQGVMCRQFQQVLYPLTNDQSVLEACLELDPAITAYRKFYIRLFRENFPEYAAIPYGESLIPLAYPPWVHNLHRMFGRRLGGPMTAMGLARRFPTTPNNWSLWLKSSTRLRSKLAGYLLNAKIANPRALDAYLTGLADGSLQGTGKLFHLAAIANWLS